MTDGLIDRAGLDDASRAEILAVVETHAMLADVTRWAFGQEPPAALVAVIEQDEYSIDVVVRWDRGAAGTVFLAYDST